MPRADCDAGRWFTYRLLGFYNRAMHCPACKEPLMALEFEGVEVDHCAACGGVWLDAEEVELLFGSQAEATRFLHALDPGDVEKDRQLLCPRCGKPMRKGNVGSVTYDYSPMGLWFDKGELSQVLAHDGLPAESQRITAWLREVFPHA